MDDLRSNGELYLREWEVNRGIGYGDKGLRLAVREE